MRDAVGDGAGPTPERDEELLERRARALAQMPPDVPGAGEVTEIVAFALADERYCIAACDVQEIMAEFALEPVPGAPRFLAGIANRRGELLAVFDLASFFGLAEARSETPRILVLGREQAEFGILVDGTEEVRSLRDAEVLEPPSSLSAIERSFLLGVTADALIVLDGTRLLADERLYVDQDRRADR